VRGRLSSEKLKLDHSGSAAEQLSATESLFLLLYVDDDRVAVELMENIVKQVSDLRLITAPTAETGLPLAEAYLPNLMLQPSPVPGQPKRYNTSSSLELVPETTPGLIRILF